MNILVFNFEYPPLGGGGGVFLKDIGEVLAADHRVTVITSQHGSAPRYEQNGTLEIYREPVLLRKARSTATMVSMLSYFPSSLWRGYQLLRRRRFDVINSHFVVPSAPSAHLLAKWFSLPHVITIHGGDLFDPSKTFSPHRVPLVRQLVRRLLSKGDRVVAASRNTMDNAANLYGIRREIDLIPLGIKPFALPHRGGRELLGLQSDDFVMVTIGRVVRRKNLEHMVEVVQELSDPKAVLVVIGEGPYRAALADLSRERGVESQIRFVGRVSDQEKARYLVESDLYVSTSDHEGFGLVFLEALHSGLPVVCYDHGGQTDFLVQGETGLLVEHGNVEGFVAAVQRLRDDPELREKCRRVAREVVARYYIDRCAENYVKLFEGVTGQQESTHRESQG